eukprot:gene42275-57236_t
MAGENPGHSAFANHGRLRCGQVDWIEVPPPDGIASLKSAGFAITTGSYPHVWPWFFNIGAKDSPFKDVKVRQALNYCVDRAGLVSLLAGTAEPSAGWLKTSDPNFGYGKMKEPLLQATALLRAFNASAANGRYLLTNPEGTLGQAALRSKAVRKITARVSSTALACNNGDMPSRAICAHNADKEPPPRPGRRQQGVSLGKGADWDLNSRVPLNFPGGVARGAIKGECGLGQPRNIERLACKTDHAPSGQPPPYRRKLVVARDECHLSRLPGQRQQRIVARGARRQDRIGATDRFNAEFRRIGLAKQRAPEVGREAVLRTQ